MVDLLNQPFLKMKLDDLPPEAWKIVSGGTDAGNLGELYRTIPYLFRGVDLRANAMTAMPFSIYKGDSEVDTSADYQNTVGFLPELPALLGLVEAALAMWGKSYLFRERNLARTLSVRYLLPSSVKPTIDEERGLTGFMRTVGSRSLALDLEDICYIWLRDPFVEVGPPTTSAVQAAAAAGNVLLNMDRFEAAFFARGAIKATILAVPASTQKDERDRLEKWWTSVVNGIKNAFTSKVINADAVKPTVVGEGLEALSRTNLDEKKARAMCLALGIPFSILFSDAANYATAQQDEANFYSKAIIPDARVIQDAVNAQILSRSGHRLVFHPEQLSCFQEDESARASSLTALTTALENPLSEVSMRLLGYEIDEESMAMLRAYWAQKRGATVVPTTPAATTPDGEVAGEEGSSGEAVLQELRAWRRKALRRVKDGRPAAKFESDVIPPALAGALAGALEGAGSADDVHRVFESIWQGYP